VRRPRTRPLLDDEPLAKPFAEMLRNDAFEQVGRAAGCEGHQHADRSGRPGAVLRGHRARQGRYRQAAGERAPEHAVFPLPLPLRLRGADGCG
jgi:hypothetical protein